MNDDSDGSNVNGKANRGATGNKSKLGQPLAVGKRRRTNNSDEVDIETEADSVAELEQVNEAEETAEKTKEKLSFFSPLIRAAASMNPQQFELPLELIEPIIFPGKVGMIQNFIWQLSNLEMNGFWSTKVQVRPMSTRKMEQVQRKNPMNWIMGWCLCL